MIKKTLAGVALAVLALLAVPTAAQAYVPVPPAGTITIAPGGTATVPFSGFAPNESVSFTLTGENASGATLAAVVAAVDSKSIAKTAGADGSVSVSVTLPANASGSYTLSGSGAESHKTASASLSVTSGSSLGGGGSDGGLPNTGAMDPTLGIWAGGGLLALGAAFVIVLTVVRRQKATN